MSQTTTLWDLKTILFQQMNETANNTTYTNNDRDRQKLNDVVKSVCSWFVKSLLNPEVCYKCLDVPFLRRRQYFQFKDPIATTADINVWDTTIYMDTTDLDTTGAVYAQGVVVTYTGKTATSLTWCSGVIADFESGTYFTKAFKVNADFDKSYRLFHMYNNIQREIFEVQREDERYQRAKYRSFVVVLDENTMDKYIIVRGFARNDRFLFKYYEKVTNMVDDTDICVIDDDYCTKVVIPLAAGELLMESQTEDWEYINKLSIWYSKLDEMYTKYTLQEVDMDKMAKQKPYNYSAINSFGLANTRYTRSWYTVY